MDNDEINGAGGVLGGRELVLIEKDNRSVPARTIAKDSSTDRKAVRDALEEVTNDQELIKFYRRPFTAARHEALDAGGVFLARYERDGSLARGK